MTLQTNMNILVAAKRETTTGVAVATVTGATRVRLVSSAGLDLKRNPIQSLELRADGLTSMGRLGAKTVEGSYLTEISAGGATDLFLEAVMRSTWATATAVPFASMTTLAFGSNTVTAAAGDFLATVGIKVGDVFSIVGTSVSANNNVNRVVTAVGTLTITTTPAAFTTLAATATGTLTRLKKVITAATPSRYSHTIEQYDVDTDLSQIFLGCRCIGAKLSFKPNGMATAQFSFLGMDQTALTTGTSPFFTSPTLTTGLTMIADDSSIRYNGAVVSTFTGFDLDFTLSAKTEPVIGSFVSPDVFDNKLAVSGTISGLRSDFTNLTLFTGETEFEVQILLQATNTTNVTPDALSLYLPRVKFSSLTAPVGGGDGPKVETLNLMVGPKTAATGYDGGICSISSSAP